MPEARLGTQSNFSLMKHFGPGWGWVMQPPRSYDWNGEGNSSTVCTSRAPRIQRRRPPIHPRDSTACTSRAPRTQRRRPPIHPRDSTACTSRALRTQRRWPPIHLWEREVLLSVVSYSHISCFMNKLHKWYSYTKHFFSLLIKLDWSEGPKPHFSLYH